MKQLLYRIIYTPGLNRVLRAINKALAPILPSKVKLPPSGVMTIKNEAGKQLKIKTNQTNYLTQLPGVDRVHSSFALRTVIKKTEVPIK